MVYNLRSISRPPSVARKIIRICEIGRQSEDLLLIWILWCGLVIMLLTRIGGRWKYWLSIEHRTLRRRLRGHRRVLTIICKRNQSDQLNLPTTAALSLSELLTCCMTFGWICELICCIGTVIIARNPAIQLVIKGFVIGILHLLMNAESMAVLLQKWRKVNFCYDLLYRVISLTFKISLDS